jgi:hypothetical protein
MLNRRMMDDVPVPSGLNQFLCGPEAFGRTGEA